MDLGVAGTIRTIHVRNDDYVSDNINLWLDRNPDVEVIEIKFSTNMSSGYHYSSALIIYRTN